MNYKKVSIIGGGKVGCVLGKRLKEKGYRIVSVISRTFASSMFCADFVECKLFSTLINDISPETNLILIAVPDIYIHNIVEELGLLRTLNFNKISIFHTSGSLTSKILNPLKLLGAKIFSLHPFQTFASISSVLNNMDGVYYGIEGLKSQLKIAEKIVQDLGGKSVVISPELKPIYHTAGVFASNYLVTLIHNIHVLLHKLNINPSESKLMLRPILNQTISNLEHYSSYDALTGPISRGDSKIVDLHLKTLSIELPLLVRFYISMGLETLDAAKVSKKITSDQYHEILTIFIDYLKNETIKDKFKL